MKLNQIKLDKENDYILSNNLETKYNLEEELDIISVKNKTKEEKILFLEIMESSLETKGKKIEITPTGYQFGLRHIRDGITYFGYEKPTKNSKEKLIDYIINPKDEIIDNRFIGQHFRIKYDKKNSLYYLKDLGHGFGTFVKLNKIIEIKNNYLIGIGNNYIILTLGYDEDTFLKDCSTNENTKDDDNDKIINVKIFSENLKHGILSFDKSKEKIIVGRCSEADVIIEDNMLSRLHCTIFFRNNKWYLSDGFITDNRINKSTNGTWLYAFDDIIIENGTIFKSNHNLFICSFE